MSMHGNDRRATDQRQEVQREDDRRETAVGDELPTAMKWPRPKLREAQETVFKEQRAKAIILFMI